MNKPCSREGWAMVACAAPQASWRLAAGTPSRIQAVHLLWPLPAVVQTPPQPLPTCALLWLLVADVTMVFAPLRLYHLNAGAQQAEQGAIRQLVAFAAAGTVGRPLMATTTTREHVQCT